MTTRTAIVAGGTAGVGRATVESLLKRGWKVGVMARGRDRLDALKAEAGDVVEVEVCDVSDDTALVAASDALAARLGPVGVWINCAMLTSFSPFREVEPDEFQAIVDTTFIGQVNGTRAALRLLEPKGLIVNVGSGLAYRSVPFQAAYCGSKAAIMAFTASVRSELIREGSGIEISQVQLPAVNTPQFDWARNRLEKKPQPAPPIYSAGVAARAILKAIETRPRELMVGQSVLKLVFGTMILPDVLDSMMSKVGAKGQKSEADEPGGRPDNLHAPVDRPGTPEGSFGDRASKDGIIVDGDLVRKLLFFGVPGAIFIVGILLGALLF